jgi:hypothetical protein
MATVLLTGGTGLIGKYLSKKLNEKGYRVIVLSRASHGNSENTFGWDIQNGKIDERAVSFADYIIHLSGANIGQKRWTKARKKLIIDSRVKSAQILFEAVKKSDHKIKAFISASATGYYGAVTNNKIFNENDVPANDFLGQTCKAWEQSADKFEELGIRTVKIRAGVVLTKQEGALSKMMLPVKMGFASALGSGRQFLPWIHIDDLCNIYVKAIDDEKMKGTYNAVAPEHITNSEFMKTIAGVLHKPFWFPNIPGIMLKLLFGEMSGILLKGSMVSSEKIRNAGYIFQFDNIKSALKNLVLKS